jgi:hypothetical protein
MWPPTRWTDASGMTTTEWPPLHQRPVPARWGWLVWTALVAVAAVEFMAALVALLLINIGSSTSCGDVPTMGNVRAGELSLSLALAVGVVPWVVAAVLSPRRAPLVVAGALAASPLIFGLLAGLAPSFWDNGFCF